MSLQALRHLRIEYLRGAVRPFELAFDPRKKLTLVYGENGTGKSTICDALDFLGNGKVGSLDDRGLGSTSGYWPSIGRPSSDVKVVLESSESEVVATLRGREAVVESPGRPRVVLLRRHQILGLVQARPADRYDAIRSFIDVAAVERAEEALKKHINELTEGRKSAAAAIVENELHVTQFWEQAGSPPVSSFVWARQETVIDDQIWRAEASGLRALINAARNLVRLNDRRVSILAALDEARLQRSAAQASLQALLETLTKDADSLEELLRASKKHLELHPNPDRCPLCESPERVKDLVARVDARSAQFRALKEARHRDSTSQLSLLTSERVLRESESEFSAATEALVETLNGQLPLTMRTLDHLLPSGPDELEAWSTRVLPIVEDWEKQESSLRTRVELRGLLRKALRAYDENFRKQVDLEALLPKLESTYRVFVEERRRFTDEMLLEIASRVGELYEQVHPSESLNRIGLKLDPKKPGSLEIDAEYAGKLVSPQAYYSQSHLETLGLCIFLALAEREEPACTILVLDDVLSSVDEPHVERVIGMLFDETPKFQHCLITTHYRPWREKFRWGWVKSGECHFVELSAWSLKDGLRLIKSQPEPERLRALLDDSPLDCNLVCAKAGVILEATLHFLTRLYECRLPRRDTLNFSLRELLEAVNKKLRDSLRVEILGRDNKGPREVFLGPILEDLLRISPARNIFGAHYNESSFDLPDGDAELFGKRVLEFAEALLDPDLGWPGNSKSGSYWATSGDTRRLHPLKQPS